MNLNVGGVIGAHLFGFLTGGILLALGHDNDRVAKVGIGALIAGAFAGNFGWSLLFPPSRIEDDDDRPRKKTNKHYDDDDDERPRRKTRKRSE